MKNQEFGMYLKLHGCALKQLKPPTRTYKMFDGEQSWRGGLVNYFFLLFSTE